jgi:hypothetical protein
MAANRHCPPHKLLLICLIIVIVALACQVANARLLSSTPDARVAETPHIKSGRSLSEPTPVNVSRGLVEPFTEFPKGVAYAAGYIFILHESGQIYRCNVSNQHETCYQQNKMYRGNAFNWIDHNSLNNYFARRMAVEDDEHIITASGTEMYRCSTRNPYSCQTIYKWGKDASQFWQIVNIAVGGGRIFAGVYKGQIHSFDIANGYSLVSSPLSMRRLSV